MRPRDRRSAGRLAEAPISRAAHSRDRRSAGRLAEAPISRAAHSLAIAFVLLACGTAAAAPTLLTHRAVAYGGTLSLHPDAGRVDADLEVRVRAAGAPAELCFATPLPVLAVRDEAGGDLQFRAEKTGSIDLTCVTMPAPLADGQEAIVRISASGQPACDPGSAIGWRSCALGDVSWLDLATVLPASLATDHATLDLWVDVPAGNVVAGSGETVATEPAGQGRERHRVVQTVPSFSHGIAAGPYQPGALPTASGWVRTLTLLEPAVQATVGTVLDEAASVLAFLSDRVGPKAPPAVSIAQIRDAGAAYALPGLVLLPEGSWTGLGGGTLHPPDLAFLVRPHELAHQWFPWTVQASPYGGAWLSEGFAEFLAIEWLAGSRGEESARETRAALSLRYRRLVDPGADTPLAMATTTDATDRDAYFALVYGKGALAVYAIRAAAGPAAFDAALRDMVADLGGADALWDATVLSQRVAKAGGAVLAPALGSWYLGRGYPVYAVTVMSGDVAGGGPLRLRVARSSAVPGTTFAMPVAFRVATDAGSFDRTAVIDADEVALEWDLPGRVLGVAVDPDVTFVRRVTPGLPGDVDLSGEVDALDLLRVAWAFGSAWDAEGYLEDADIDDSGVVDDADLAPVLATMVGSLPGN
jgi:hypothetical protein